MSAELLDRLEALERRFNGPVPRPLSDAADHDPDRLRRLRAEARAAALARLAAAARAEACALRTLNGGLTPDLRRRLAGCGARLAWARAAAETWRRRADGSGRRP